MLSSFRGHVMSGCRRLFSTNAAASASSDSAASSAAPLATASGHEAMSKPAAPALLDVSSPTRGAFDDAVGDQAAVETLTTSLPHGGEGDAALEFANYKAREAQLRLELAQARADAEINIEAAQRAATEQAAHGAALQEQGLLADQAKLMRLQLLSMLTIQADALGSGEWLRDRLTDHTTMNGEVPHFSSEI